MKQENLDLIRDAALACGLPVSGFWESSYGGYSGVRIRPDDNPGGYCWNSLTSPQDCLEAMTTLKMNVYYRTNQHGEHVVAEAPGVLFQAVLCDSDHSHVWATRRVITLAAAEVWRTKQKNHG